MKSHLTPLPNLNILWVVQQEIEEEKGRLSIKKCRELLKAESHNLSDEQVLAIRDFMYRLAAISWEQYQYVGTSGTYCITRSIMGRFLYHVIKTNPPCWCRGQHEPLISEVLFYKVQCGRNLTGSASKGKGRRYFNYHCISPCGNRLKTEDANDKFIKKLAIAVKEEHITLFECIMRDHYHKSNREQSKAASDLKIEIEKNRERIVKTQQLMIDGSYLPLITGKLKCFMKR